MKIRTSIGSKILMLNLHLHSTSNSKTYHPSQLTQDFFDINSCRVLNTLTLAFNPSHQKWLGLKMTYNRHISSCFKNSIMIHKFWVLYENYLKVIAKRLTYRFQVAMRLFSNRSQMMSKCGKNRIVAHKAQLSVSLMFLPHFDVLCDLLLNRCMATWNLFVLYNKELKKVLMMTSSIYLSSNRLYVRTNQNTCITELII